MAFHGLPLQPSTPNFHGHPWPSTAFHSKLALEPSTAFHRPSTDLPPPSVAFQSTGIFTGSTVHELAGVVAAGNSMGTDVASVAVITKLLRVFLLEPWIVLLFYLGIGQVRSEEIAPDGF